MSYVQTNTEQLLLDYNRDFELTEQDNKVLHEKRVVINSTHELVELVDSGL